MNEGLLVPATETGKCEEHVRPGGWGEMFVGDGSRGRASSKWPQMAPLLLGEEKGEGDDADEDHG